MLKRKRGNENDVITSKRSKFIHYQEPKDGIYRDGNVPPINVTSMTVTGSNGEQVYVALEEEEPSIVSLDEQEQYSKRKVVNFLDMPIEQMMEQIEEEEIKRALRMEQEDTMEQKKNPLNFGGQLYVDKYAPATFTDLLTSDQVNREVLRWVKEWDSIVFPEKVKDKQQQDGIPAGPEQKILLISGPPGIGKTTLAHVVAKQAGYNPVEINASDDRSSARLMELITAHTQTRNVFGNKKPTCLIIDEIDGLHNSETRSAITALLKFAYPTKRNKNKKDTAGDKENNKKPATKASSSDKKSGTNKKSSNGLTMEKTPNKKSNAPPRQLNRPIICICNDHYAPVLRELRLKSKLFVFRRRDTLDHHNMERLVNRISFICTRENLIFPKKWIRELAIKSDGDIRSCLNTIQFIANGNYEKVNLAEKDMKKDYFDIMTRIFDKKDNSTSTPTRVHMNNMVSLLGDEMDRYETLLMGCFENYPTVRFNSSLLLREVSTVLEWTSWSDVITQFMKRNLAFSLGSYNLYAIMQYHLNCSAMYKQNFHRYNYPKRDGDSFREREQRINICRSMFSNEMTEGNKVVATTSCKHYWYHPVRSSTDASADLIPYLVHMLQPNSLIKTNNTYTNNLTFSSDGSSNLASFRNESDRVAAKKIVDLCVEYGLSYRYTNENQGGVRLELEPPIQKLTDFSIQKPDQQQQQNKYKQKQQQQQVNSSNPDLPYAMKKIIASEIKKEKLRRAVAAKQLPATHDDKENKKEATTSKPMNSPPPVRTPTKRQSTGQSAFTSSPRSSPTTAATSDISVYFHYHEGMTNAIRRPAKLRAFM
jgi:chromosome transmission fidelity protein 18